MTNLRWDNVRKPHIERPPLLVPSSKSAQRKQKPQGTKNSNEKAGQARNEPQHLARFARATGRATGTLRPGSKRDPSILQVPSQKPSPAAVARKDLKWVARQDREDRLAALLMKLNQQNTLVDAWR